MKIGIMLRHFDQHGGGVKTYTHNIVKEVLALDSGHEFILIYSDPRFVGTFADRPEVREVAYRAPSLALWDQVIMPMVERKERLDLIFNPKYSLPLTARCKTVFVCHGVNWVVLRQPKPWYDHVCHRFLVPRYMQKADGIIVVSHTTKKDLVDNLDVSPERVHTVYHGVEDAFKLPPSADRIEEIRRRYRLPDRFFLYIGQIYPPKNFGRLLEAYSRIGPVTATSLVVAGEHRSHCRRELSLVERLGISPWVQFTGWIDREILPSFYAMALALVLPSLYESFGLPIVEAMASGTPVITSNCFGAREIAGEAAMLVNPFRIESIAEGMETVLFDMGLRNRLIAAGRKRAEAYSWKSCALETLRVLETVARG
jgi:glycosyltransferase involved in cell wall biosynthesis